MSDRERGFLVIQRQIQSSDVWLSISAEQRSVFMSMLLLANWTPGRFLYGSEWVEVGRGELAHSLDTIAKHAKVSIKVVRSALTKLIAGHVVGTRQGTIKGTGPRVLTFYNYNKHQDVDDAAGTGMGMEPGNEEAQQGHGVGTTGAPIEPSKPDQPVTPLAPSPPVSPPSAVVLTIPCVGSGPKEVGITEAQIHRWEDLFPGVDVLGQVRTAVAWCEANPTKRKTASGIPRFIASWLTRAQNSQPPKATAVPESVTRKVPVLDLAWLEQLPEQARAKAKNEWSEAEQFLTRTAYPSDLGQMLADALDSIRSTYTRQGAVS